MSRMLTRSLKVLGCVLDSSTAAPLRVADSSSSLDADGSDEGAGGGLLCSTGRFFCATCETFLRLTSLIVIDVLMITEERGPGGLETIQLQMIDIK